MTEPQNVCPTCHRIIVVEAGEKAPNSPGDHDPAFHVAKAYGTTPPRDLDDPSDGGPA